MKNTTGQYANLSANECDRYGMIGGCDGYCPVFTSGKCKLEDVDAFKEQILTTDRYDQYALEELNKMYPELNLPTND